MSGRLTLKHIYEIALLKSEDAALRTVSLQSICASLISEAHRIGIEVLPGGAAEGEGSGDVCHNPETYAAFLKQRDIDVALRKKAIEEKKQAKMMRVS